MNRHNTGDYKESVNHCFILRRNSNLKRKLDKLTDVTLIHGETRFPAHKIILASCSDYFDWLFEGKFKESIQGEINLTESIPSKEILAAGY